MNSIFGQGFFRTKKLFLSFLFALAYAQSPLFSSNQNTYFLHGLADSARGNLGADWMSRTADPFPVFSFFVELSSRLLPDFVFHIYYLLLLMLFIYSALEILQHVHKEGNDSSQSTGKTLLSFLIVTGLFSLVFSFLSSKLLGFNLSYFFQNGLADQYVLGRVLQPSTFGIFLICSVALFLKKRWLLSVLALGVAVNLHATYLLSAAFFTIAYVFILVLRGDRKTATLLGLLCLLVALPNLIYTYLTFTSQPAESVLAAQKILVDFRIPHHTKLSHWFGWASIFKISLILIALLSIKKNRELFLIIALPLSLATCLSAVQFFSDSYFLALIFPWRVSVLLVPISVLVLVGKLVEKAQARRNSPILFNKIERVSFISLLSVFVVGGIASFFLQYEIDKKREATSIESLVLNTKTNTSIYLVPPDMERFRLASEAPIFVDKKTHPYRSEEVREWYRRYKLADSYYNDPIDCKALDAIMINHRLTHVIDQRIVSCPFLSPISTSDQYKLYGRR